MEKQIIINAITALNGTVDVLTRAGEVAATTEVVVKLLELVKKL